MDDKPKTFLHIGRNFKIDKSDASQVYRTAHLNLAPADTSGIANVCPRASEGCKNSCLFTAGWGATPRVQEARIRDTLYWKRDREGFIRQLKGEIDRHERYCEKRGLVPVVRLNMTSDILWEHYGVIQDFPWVQFYDYTKIPNRKTPKNYHLTFSLDETNREVAMAEAKAGRNICVVYREPDWQRFKAKELAEGRIIDGDKDDLRFLDPPRVIVGVKAKGRAVYDTTGFVVDADPLKRFQGEIAARGSKYAEEMLAKLQSVI